MKLNPPRKLENTDVLTDFDCGNHSLNYWFKRRALQNNIAGGTQTSVITNEENRITAFFSLVMGEVFIEKAHEHLRKDLDIYPIPIIKITRMAVDLDFQGLGIGKGMIKHVMKKAVEVSESIGCKAIVVDPIDDKARQFYEFMQFQSNSNEDDFMYITVSDIVENL